MAASLATHYLAITEGPRAGAVFPLRRQAQTRIGRGLECQVVLTDPLSSRVHAIVYFEDDAWWVRDAGSRNGTFVNGQKANEARLIDGCTIRIGSTRFAFHEGEPAVEYSPSRRDMAQTVVFDTPINPRDTGSYDPSQLDAAAAQSSMALQQFTVKLLPIEEPDEVVRVTLDTLRERTRATFVGFLWVSDEGRLRPKQVSPADAEGEVSLSESLTELVCKQRRAIRLNNQPVAKETASLRPFADAICVPLIHEETTIGALHLYLEQGHFEDRDFRLAVTMANIAVLALVRARHQAVVAADHSRLAVKSAEADELLGDSKPMRDLKSKISRIARATGCVLVRGESGSGKELVARALHRASARADRPLLSVNCAAIPAELMESQLFGHKKGAFTGADADHVGLFERADSGTLFLDEVGEMTLDGQAKLLRILEGHPFLPVGGVKEVSADVRVIAATNRDLQEFVRGGKFREDLYYRLSVFELSVPPLRERGEDVELLLGHFFEHFKSQHGRPQLGLADAAREKLLVYDWPGNVRQLRNVIDSAVVMADSDKIEPDDLPLRDVGGRQMETLRIDHWEERLIREALKRSEGNVNNASRLTGLARATMYRKIEEYGIPRDQSRE